jgi:hypothetical protein
VKQREIVNSHANDIKTAFINGMTIKQIADNLKVKRDLISEYLDEIGIRPIKRSIKVRRFSEDEENAIKEEYLNGDSSVTLGKKYHCHPSVILSIVRRNGGNTRNNKENSRLYTHNETFFEVIDTEQKAYWLGFFYADGYVSSVQNKHLTGLSLSVVDKEHIEKFKNDINATNPIKIYTPTLSGYSDDDYCRILLSSETTYKQLIMQGVLEHKTSILMPPPHVPLHLKRHFIRGYFDGDGCITYYMHYDNKRDKRYFSSTIKIVGTSMFLDYIKEYIEENNIAHIGKYYRRKKIAMHCRWKWVETIKFTIS